MANLTRQSGSPQDAAAERPPGDPPARGDSAGAQAPPEDLKERAVRYLKRASVVGAVATIALHILLAIVAAFIAIQNPSGQIGGAPGEQVFELAVMSQSELDAIEADALDLAEPTVEIQEQAEAAEIPALDDPAGMDLAAELSDLATPSVTGSGGGSEGAGGFDIGGAGDGAASFLGVEARGRRFVFLVDISGSMMGERIEAVRRALNESVQSLDDRAEFVIVLFSHEASVLGGRTRWLRADRSGKRWAERAIDSIQVYGGTNPLTGFEIIFTLSPRPDAIYFMTDGIFAEAEADAIIAQNRRPTVPVHAICFEDRSGEAMMRRIAEMSGGTYTYVPLDRSGGGGAGP